MLNVDATRRVFLKKSLGTKDRKAALVAVKHVLADFDRTIAKAEALLTERPVVAVLSDAQIKRMAEYHYAAVLSDDEEERREGTGSEQLFQDIAAQIKQAGVEVRTPFEVGAVPDAGLSDREIVKRGETLEAQLETAPHGLGTRRHHRHPRAAR